MYYTNTLHSLTTRQRQSLLNGARQISSNFSTKKQKILISMVRHVILWKLKEELSPEEKQSIKKEIKAGLEGLVGKVPGLVEVTVNIDGRIDSSNCDLMLDSV